MELNLSGKRFLVSGASSGFGKAVATCLIAEGAHVIINARGEEKLLAFQNQFPDQTTALVGDITTDATISELLRMLHQKELHGALINAGGPPAKSVVATEMDDWDDAYERILRWKVKLTKEILPIFEEQGYGRLLFLESASVRQPIENLVLSNSLRMAVVGFVKTLSLEIADKGITANVIAPGYHATDAMERLFIHKSQAQGISTDEAKRDFLSDVKAGHLGDPKQLASLATWLLSPHAAYVTGQTITVDGGLVKGI